TSSPKMSRTFPRKSSPADVIFPAGGFGEGVGAFIPGSSWEGGGIPSLDPGCGRRLFPPLAAGEGGRGGGGCIALRCVAHTHSPPPPAPPPQRPEGRKSAPYPIASGSSRRLTPGPASGGASGAGVTYS